MLYMTISSRKDAQCITVLIISMNFKQENLLPSQLTNHFLKNVAITTKVGLLKSLQSLIWLADVSSNDVIPRGYDLSIPAELLAFMDDYR